MATLEVNQLANISINTDNFGGNESCSGPQNSLHFSQLNRGELQKEQTQSKISTSSYNYQAHSIKGENTFSFKKSEEIGVEMSMANNSTISSLPATVLSPIAPSSAISSALVSNQARTQSCSPSRPNLFAHNEAPVRIHTPNNNDVLSGRGGGINNHPGNIIFRNWVKDRKESYNLAPNKVEKAKVSREIIELVLKSNGRFLKREEVDTGNQHSFGVGSTSQYWVEIEDSQAMAKTSQALREGAPAIRSAFKEKTKAICGHTKIRSRKKKQVTKFTKKNTLLAPHDMINRLIVERTKIAENNGLTEEVHIKNDQFEPPLSSMSCVPTKETNSTSDVSPTTVPQTKFATNKPSAYFEDVNDNAIVSLENTPILHPVVSTLEPPELSFALPPTSFSSKPLPQVFSQSKKPLDRSHSIALSDLPEPNSINYQDSILFDHDSSFTDPFVFDVEGEKYMNQHIEGNPDLSPVSTSIIVQADEIRNGNRKLDKLLRYGVAKSNSMSKFCSY